MNYPDVGLVYARADQDVSDSLSRAMAENGIVVADFKGILDPGRKFEEMIKETDNACRVILYLSSAAANASKYVSQEAAPIVALAGRRRDPTLVPILLDHSRLRNDLAEIQLIQGVYAPGLNIGDVINEMLATVRQLLSRGRVFVCHSSHDKEAASQLCEELGQMHPECDYWFDSDAVPTGVDIEVGIRAGVSRARYFLVFVTRNLVEAVPRSRYLTLEFQLAKEREQRRRESGGFFVIPVNADKDYRIEDEGISWLKTDTLVNICGNRDEGLKQIVQHISTAVEDRL